MNHLRKPLHMIVLVLLALNLSSASADLITEVNGSSYVSYPVTHHAQIDAMIYQDAHIAEYLRVLNNLSEGSIGLSVRVVNEQMSSDGHYYSCVISANGKMPQGRPAQTYHAMIYDMETEERIYASDLFKDWNTSQAFIAEKLENDVSGILSDYMDNPDLLPLPEHVAVFDESVTFYYDASQFSFLSGDSGAVSFTFDELTPYLDLSDNSVCGSMHQQYTDNAAQKAAILQQSIEILNRLKSIPFDQLIRDLRQPLDSTYYPGGAAIQVEYPLMRENYLLTDENETQVTGLLIKRGELSGLIVGKTTRTQYQEMMGLAQATVPVSSVAAEEYLISAGMNDVYETAERYIILHTNENGILDAIILR